LVAFRETSNLVDQAMQNRQDLWIRYRDLNSAFSEEVITPLEWIDEDKTLFQAYCHLRSEEKPFNIFTIVEARIHENPVDTARGQAVGTLPDPVGVQAAPMIARPISRVSSDEEEKDSPQLVVQPISRVETPADWHRLVGYYYDCLRHEQQAQVFFDRKTLFLIALERQQIFEFLQGKIDLQFTLTFRYFLQSFRNFINAEQHPGETLCLGTSFFCLDETNIAPLLFTSVAVEFQIENQVQLKAGNYNINIAPLIQLGLNPDEIAAFQREAGQFIQSHSQLTEIENYLLAKYSSLFSHPVKLFPSTTYALDDVPSLAVFDGTGLFWLLPAQAKSTVDELHELVQESHWNSAPDSLLSILNPKQTANPPSLTVSPEEDAKQESSFAFSTLSKQQRETALWAASKPITVISGPPGSGKTQVLLNILLQAFIDGKTVLFTSQSDQVVNALTGQVIDRLQFPGALRIGSFENHLQMTRRIDHLLTQIHKENGDEFQQQHASARQALIQSENRLDIIQDLRGKEVSYESEVKEIQRLLPDVIVKKVLKLNLPYDEQEKQLFLDALSKLSDQVRELVNSRIALQQQIEAAILNQEHRAATHVIHEFEDRWGPFGGDKLSFKRLARLEDVIGLTQLWLDLLAALEAKRDQDSAQARLRDIEQKANRSMQKLTEEQGQLAEYISTAHRKGDLVSAHKALGTIKSELEKQIESPQRWHRKITKGIRLLNPNISTIQRLSAILLQFDWPEVAASLTVSSLPEQLKLSSSILSIVRTAILIQKSHESRTLFEVAQARAAALSEPLPQAIRKDINKLALSAFAAQTLLQVLADINEKAYIVLQQRKETANKISQLINSNNLQLKLIQQMQEAFSGAERAFFKINDEIAENQLEQYLRIWRRITWLWELHSIMENITDQKKVLPGEAKALFTYQFASNNFLTTLQEFLYATWMDRAADLDRATIQGVTRYSLAIQEETQTGEALPTASLSQLRQIKQANFPHLLRLFPIWFASTADVAESFPLTSELFDLVIVDHANLGSIPAGISLLYRAKSVVVAGDPRQRQFSTLLNPVMNRQLMTRHAIDPQQFSYPLRSLFDLAQDSAQQTEIFLTEHYRSDPRIATFISQEFYDRPLRIYTDLVKNGYQRETVNHTGGIYWVNIKGAFQREGSGSAYNLTEQELVQELLLKLVDRARKNDRPSPSIAVISPFRAQALRLKEWIDSSLAADHSIRAGIPQDFQGEEYDIVILSPVISSGMPKEALDGAETTSQLLNLAISRARVSLIIVGDWQFCYNQLPSNHGYHRLARYTREKCASLVEALSNLSLLGGPISCANGYFSDPSDPEHSRTTLEQLLLSCRDTIFWMDPQLDQQVIDLLDEILDREKNFRVKEFRLLTTEKQVNPPAGKPALRPEMLQTFAKYLANMGYTFECRTIPVEASNRGILSDSTGVILLPQFQVVFRKHRQTSEFSVARASAEELDLLWKRANPITPRIMP
jgi:hypothetical protein